MFSFTWWFAETLELIVGVKYLEQTWQSTGLTP